jgi:hypothetical protein
MFVCQGHRLQFDLHKACKIKHTLLNNSRLYLLYSPRHQYVSTNSPFLYTNCFMPFCFNAHCQNIPLLNLRPLIFCFNAHGPAALCYVNRCLLNSLSWVYHFTFMRFLFTLISVIQLCRKISVWCMRYQHEGFYKLFKGTLYNLRRIPSGQWEHPSCHPYD